MVSQAIFPSPIESTLKIVTFYLNITLKNLFPELFIKGHKSMLAKLMCTLLLMKDKTDSVAQKNARYRSWATVIATNIKRDPKNQFSSVLSVAG